jgi:hypothetical protein
MSKSKKSKSTIEIELVGGSYDSTRARELLIGLIQHQINDYKLNNLQFQVRNETSDHHAIHRIAELQEAEEQLMEFLGEVDERFFRIQIACKAHIEIKKELVHLN